MTERAYVGAPAGSAAAAVGAHAVRLLGPLWERFRLGEGLLLVVNAAVLWFTAAGLASGIARLLLSAGVLATLYSTNDLYDAEADRCNPKKNQRLVALLLEGRAAHTWLLVGVHGALVLAAALSLGSAAALTVAAMLLVNLAYSSFAKGTPLADLVAVTLWGALFTAIAAAPVGICLLVGALTLLMHVFQMHVDVEVDSANAVRTSAVVARSPVALVSLACLLLALVLARQLGPGWAATALLPLAAHLCVRRTEAAWMCSRVYAGVVLLAALGGLPGVG